MALIKCMFCGEEISDKAEVCPKCGKELRGRLAEKSNYIKCEECGSLLPEDTEVCPNCGFPIAKAKNSYTNERIDLGKKEKTKKKVLIALGIVLALALVGTGIFFVHSMKQKEREQIQIEEHEKELKEYLENIRSTAEQMADTAIKAEETADLIRAIWYNSILEIDSYETNAYTKDKFGNFFPDFNTALQKYVNSSKYTDAVSAIETGQTKIANTMKNLKNCPDECKDEYDMIMKLYESFISICDCALNPTGNYEQFSSKLDTGLDSFLKNAQLLASYL